MTATKPALNTLIHWSFHDPHGQPCDKPVYSDAIMLEMLHQVPIADADPDFVELTIAFCQVRPPLPYVVRIRRTAFSEDTLTWLGYRQADGSYSREGE